MLPYQVLEKQARHQVTVKIIIYNEQEGTKCEEIRYS